MRPLPALVAGRSRWVLPMADRSAAVLAEAVLSQDAAQAASLIGRQLAADPPLTVWTVCRAGNASVPSSIADLARWLCQHAIEVLQWSADEQAAFGSAGNVGDSPAAAISRFLSADPQADQVAVSLQIAEIAALLADREAADRAYLLGLLDNAAGWLARCGDRGLQDVTAFLPAWLGRPDDDRLSDQVREAVAIAAGKPPPETMSAAVQTARRQAEEGRRSWLAPLAGPGSRLPMLMARLARLDALEHRFDAVLEQEKLSSMAEFAAGAGHEINNPLAIIAGRAQLFLKEETDPERRRELAMINAQVKRAHEMIADMRLFARPPHLEPKTVELVALIDALVADLAPAYAEQNVALSRSAPPGPLELEADPVQLQVALRAMCKNAWEAMPTGGRIEISLAERGDDVEIAVTDTGPGILPEHRRHLFDPFYSARQAGRGLGLGLSKCWRIVGLHGGRIEVHSNPGHGARFTITLPRRAAAAK